MTDSPGRRLRTARLTAGLTQVQLAALLGVAQTTLSGWERDNPVPRVDDFERALETCAKEQNDG